MNEHTDRELLESFRNEATRHSSFNHLVLKYQKKIYWHVRRIVIDHDDAHDVVQNVFIKVWKGLIHFKEESQLFTWLYRIATNESITFLKRKKKFISFEEVSDGLSNSIRDDHYFNGNEIEKKLQMAILTLPEKQRIVFNMRYFDEIKYEDMAHILNTSEGALKASYHHAVKKLEAFIKSTDD